MSPSIWNSALAFLPVTDNIAAALTSSASQYNSSSAKATAINQQPLDVSLTHWILMSQETNTNSIASSHPHHQKIPFFDPHFHIWDMSKFHDPEVLAPFKPMFSEFKLSDLECLLDFSSSSSPQGEEDISSLNLIGGVHIEAIARNFDGVGEVLWVNEQIETHRAEQTNRIYLPSAYLNFCEHTETVEAKIVEMKAKVPNLCSIRQILNFEPSWPHVSHNMLEDEKWLNNFQLLEKHGIRNFEVQINPHQFEAASKNLFTKYPNMNFIINHLGCLTGKDLNDDEFFRNKYLKGLRQIAARSPKNVFVKLSMIEYAHHQEQKPKQEECSSSAVLITHYDRHWSESPRIRQLVAEVVRIFGPDQCLLASNYPVSLLPIRQKDKNQNNNEDVKDMKQYQRSAQTWGRWASKFLLFGIGDRKDAVKISSRNALKVYQGGV